MRCDQCKWWKKNEDGYSFPEIGECIKAQPLWECSEWRDVGDDYRRVMKVECEGMKMFVQDGSDYHATLLTRPEFYCAEFEK